MNKETEKILAEAAGSEDGDEKLELDRLRREKSLNSNLEAELRVLMSLFPELTADEIPDEVFENTDNGKGLAAQYALWYLTDKKQKEETQKTNEKNARSAPPDIEGAGDEAFFTPEMVRTMSDKDVRRHYKAIMKSMEKWNDK